jgi:hypothetical protein
MNRARFLIVLVALTSGVPLMAAAGVQAVRVPGTKVNLRPPDGFSVAERFSGFENAAEQASIMVSELPAPVEELTRGMTKSGLASKGMNLLGSTSEKVGGHAATLIHVAQQAAGRDFLKWMLVTGDSKTSILVVGTFPKSASGKVGEAIRSAVLTTEWAASSSVDPLEGLAFRIEPTSKLRIAGQVSGTLLLTETGKMVTAGPAEALYAVARSISAVPISDLAAFSEARAKVTAQLQDIRNFRGKALEVDGLKAYELEADAKDSKTGVAMRLYQVIALENDGYFMAQGLITVARAPAMLPEFRRITKSLQKAPGSGSDRPTRH